MSTYVFKFTHAKWARCMTEYGTVRIGTLYDYWDPRHPNGIRDSREGRIFRYRIISYSPGDPVPPVWGTSFFRIDPQIQVKIRDCSASHVGKDVIPDMYVYCTSATDDPAMFTAFGANYDTCVRIGPVTDFATELGAYMRRHMKVQEVFDGACQYGEREITYDRGRINAHPGALKELPFSDQKEFRFIGETRLRGIKPKVIRHVPLKDFFSIHSTR